MTHPERPPALLADASAQRAGCACTVIARSGALAVYLAMHQERGGSGGGPDARDLINASF
jgi:hypothetical protein